MEAFFFLSIMLFSNCTQYNVLLRYKNFQFYIITQYRTLLRYKNFLLYIRT
jgi:hypothetical protein